MNIGIVGAGRMGGSMARRWHKGGVEVAIFDRSRDALEALAGMPGLATCTELAELVTALPAPRLLWLMLPTGRPTDETIEALMPLLSSGDLLVDGANANYRDSQRHAAELGRSGIEFVDAGISGGVWGLDKGYGVMLGGSKAAVERVLPLVRILAPEPDRGWVHCGPAGAGHFTKMVHNGIEYGLMQAYAEGFALMAAREDLELPLADIAKAWCHGTVIRSWLLELTADLLEDSSALDSVAASVEDSGTGRWTVQEAVDLGIPTPAISGALMARFSSREGGDFAARLQALLRNAFGGHGLPEQHRS